MCVVSMVTNHFHDKWPSPNDWDKAKWEDYVEIKRKAEEYDRLTKQPDCHKPELPDIEKQIIDVLIKKGLIKNAI